MLLNSSYEKYEFYLQYFIKSSSEQLQSELQVDQGRIHTNVKLLQQELADSKLELPKALATVKKENQLWSVGSATVALACAVLYHIFMA